MDQIKRLLVGLFGALSLATAIGIWARTHNMLAQLGLQPNDLGDGLVGYATARADIAGLFAGMGVAMLLAAGRQSRAWTNAVLLFVVCAISGRFVSLVLDGAANILWPPIVIEAVVITILLWFRASLPANAR